MSQECLRTKEILDAWTNSRCGHGRLVCVLHTHAIAIACNSCRDKVTFMLDKKTRSFVVFFRSSPDTGRASFGEAVSFLNASMKRVWILDEMDAFPHRFRREDGVKLDELRAVLLANGFKCHGVPRYQGGA